MLFLSLTMVGADVVQAQIFDPQGSKGFFDKEDWDPRDPDGAIIHDIPEEASGAVMNKTKDQGTWGNDEIGVKALRVITEVIRNYFKPFLLIVAMFMIVGAGIGLIIGRGGEEENWKQKLREAMWGGFGLFIITASIFVVDDVFFGAEGEFFGVNDTDGEFKEFGTRGYNEIKGIVDFLTSIVIAVAVALTIFSAIQLILAGESEEQMSKMKKRIAWGIIGSLVMYLSKEFIIEDYFFPDITDKPREIKPPDYTKIIPDMIEWIGYGLSFIALLAVVALLIAAIYMIAHFGDEERVTKAKNIIKWCVIGLVLAFSAWTVVYFFANPTHDPPDAPASSSLPSYFSLESQSRWS